MIEALNIVGQLIHENKRNDRCKGDVTLDLELKGLMAARDAIAEGASAEPVMVNIPLGESGDDYQAPNYLSAIDSLTCFFMARRTLTEEEAEECLRMYARRLG